MPRPSGGLGRGLEALLPVTPVGQPDGPPDSAAGLRQIDVDAIDPNPDQPRHDLQEAELAELQASIQEHGVLQPILVTQRPGSVRYQLIAGERRWQAARRAGLRAVPAIVREISGDQSLVLALVENLQRADLNPLEEAAAFQQLTQEFGLTQDEVAKRAGRSRMAVSNTMRLLALPADIKEHLLAGRLSEGHARALLAAPSVAVQRELAELVLSRSLSVRQLEELVRRRKAEAPAHSQSQPTLPRSPQLTDVEHRLEQQLGTRVEVVQARRGGRLVVHYYSEEQLTDLCDHLLGDTE